MKSIFFIIASFFVSIASYSQQKIVIRGAGAVDTTSLSGRINTKVDSVTSSSSQCVDTIKYWVNGQPTLVGFIDRNNGLLSGGIVTLDDSTRYDVSSAIYNLICVRYTSTDQTVLLNPNTDTLPRIDIIGLNNFSTVFIRQGIPSANPQTPSVDPLTEIGLVSVYFPANSDTATVVNIYNNYTFEGTDSTAFHTLTQLNDTTAIWCDLQGRCDTLILRHLGGDGLLSGGTVTQIGDTTFFADSAFYQLQGIRYASDTLTFSVTIGDTARIDRVVVDTSGSVVVITGTESETPAIPSIDVATQVDLGFIYVAPDTVYISTPTQPNYWTLVGNRLQNNTGTSLLFSLGNTSLLVDNNYTNVPRLFSNNRIRLQANASSGSRTIIGTEGGNVPASSSELEVALGDVSAVNGDKIAQSITGRLLHSSGTQNTTFLSITPTINQTGGTGEIIGIKYSPTITAITGTHYALRTTSGDIFTTGSRNVGLWAENITADNQSRLDLNSSYTLASISTASNNGSTVVLLQDTLISIESGSQTGSTRKLQLFPDSIRVKNETGGELMFPNIPTGRDTLSTVSQVRSRYIVRPDSGIVMTVVGDTARFSVDTSYIQQYSHPYKRYVALITQTGTDAPTATVLYNNTGITFTFSYEITGLYKITSSVSLDANKCFLSAGSLGSALGATDENGRANLGFGGADLYIYTYDSNNSPMNGQLVSAPIEIRIYP